MLLLSFLQLQKLQACPPAWQGTSEADMGTGGSSAGQTWLPGQGDQHHGCADRHFASLPHWK